MWIDGDGEQHELQVTTKIDRVTSTCTDGILVVTTLDKHQILAAPQLGWPVVKEDMVRRNRPTVSINMHSADVGEGGRLVVKTLTTQEDDLEQVSALDALTLRGFIIAVGAFVAIGNY